MNIVKLFTAAFAALTLAACATAPAPAQPSPPPQDLRITLTRDVCFGFCPAYTVTIAGDGEVAYEGRAFVAVTGRQQGEVSRDEVAALLARFDAIGFDSLRDEYRAEVTDLPTFTLTLERNGRRKTVLDYGGSMAGMPDAVRALQDEVDRVAGTARWVRRADGSPVTTPPKR